MSWTGSGTPLEWALFAAVVTVLLVLDLGVWSRGVAPVTPRRALAQTGVSVAVALAFGLWLGLEGGMERAGLFLTGYLVEESLSVDNLFVFLLLFSFFKVEAPAQRRALFWGILSSIVLRAILIWTGTTLVDRAPEVLYLFGVFLLYSAARLFFRKEQQPAPEENRVLRLFRRLVPMSPDYQGTRFLTRVEGAVRATPLLAVLVVVETTDLLFALDSVPAIIGITTDKFLVYTSNVFAICALRSLYFALAGMMGRFRYLRAGLATLLVFIGAKLLLDPWITRALGHPLPVWVPLLVTLGCIGTAIAASFRVDSSASGDGDGGEREREGSHHA